MSDQLPASDDSEAPTAIATEHRHAQQTGEVFDGIQRDAATGPAHLKLLATSNGRE